VTESSWRWDDAVSHEVMQLGFVWIVLNQPVSKPLLHITHTGYTREDNGTITKYT